MSYHHLPYSFQYATSSGIAGPNPQDQDFSHAFAYDTQWPPQSLDEVHGQNLSLPYRQQTPLPGSVDEWCMKNFISSPTVGNKSGSFIHEGRHKSPVPTEVIHLVPDQLRVLGKRHKSNPDYSCPKRRSGKSKSYSDANKGEGFDNWYDETIIKTSQDKLPLDNRSAKLLQSTVLHYINYRGRRGVKLSALLSKGVFDTRDRLVYSLLECDLYPRLLVKFPDERESKHIIDPPRVGKLTTLGQYCSKIASLIVKMGYLQPDSHAMLLVSLELSAYECTATLELA